MAVQRSFKEYVADKFYDKLSAVVATYIDNNLSSLDLHSYSVKHADTAELSDITVKMVGVEDLPGSRISFDVVVEADIYISESTSRYDNSDEKYIWFSLHCTGDLNCGLSDMAVNTVEPYNQKSKYNKALDDSLVPVIHKDELEAVATDFLRRNFPKALTAPMAIDVTDLCATMGLTITQHNITKDFDVFGQILFADCDTELYDENTDSVVSKHLNGQTIVVDPKAFYLRNLGAVNNTIVHECVHWDLHRKAFELERLYNSSATQIKCRVVGGIKNESVRSATDWMEWQANALAPRIQMPLTTFKTKAYEVVKKYQRQMNTFALVDVMEPVIDELATFFCVSRQTAKIRMLDIGFEEAVGTFTFIDGHYVKPHAYRKGAIKRNQTYCISVDDAQTIAFGDLRLMAHSLQGAYVYVDSHLCLNDPKYIKSDDVGNVSMTEYGRLHVDECCLAFDLKIKSANRYGEQFYTECVLYRDANSGIEFTTVFSKEINDNVLAKADAILAQGKERQEVINGMPPTFGEALKYLMKWGNVTVEELAEAALVDPKTIQRMRNEPNYPKDIDSVVAVCIGLKLPPEISSALLLRSGFTLRLAQNESHLMYNFFLNYFYSHSIHECNEMLVAKDLPEMTGTE